jgi:hypothetical protein
MVNEEELLTFTVEDTEVEDANKWMKEQKEKHPHQGTTIGGRFSYKFTPTGLGVAVSICDNLTGESEDVTDVSMW